MRIFTVWGVRKHAPEEPELMVAWDEFSVDNNPEGYQEAVDKEVASWGSDLLTHRAIEIDVYYPAIVAAFQPPRVGGEVVE